MSYSHENTLHLTHLSDVAIRQLAPSFVELPCTDHADGRYRLRRYSVIEFRDGLVSPLDKHEFMQTEEFNHFQGDVIRHFEPILTETLMCDGMREMCAIFMQENELENGQEIEIHQMRVSAIYDETKVSPEGVHQDGFDYIAIIGIDRENIVGGELMLYLDNHEAPFFRKVLDDGEVAMLADGHLWHNATPIRAIDHTHEGHMDLFVLTARDSRHH